jgi:alpha-maltose-1-phosphate synthase
MKEFALYYASEAYSLKQKGIMGRQAAGAGFLRAVAMRQPSKLWCYTGSPALAQECGRALRDAGATQTEVGYIGYLDPARLSQAGILYRPDPNIASDAWRRLSYSGPRSYSLCGITHTTATHQVMTGFSNLLSAPLEDWDAIICTSHAVRDTLKVVVDRQAEYLAERLGATRLTIPQLPVIPLGIHTSDYAVSEEQRAAARNLLGIGSDEIAFLYLGRLSHLDKAHPLPMYLALETCSRDAKIVLIEAGWFGSEELERAFKEDAKILSPSIRHIYLDARKPDERRQAWSAADVFTSLSDNIQETFGLTPLEAMAAGLPVVVSDWNGYKETVRNGVDGFRIPTLAMPIGTGQALADLYEIGDYNYRRYCGAVSQLVAVDVATTTAAYRNLITSRDLRRKMGDAGRKRVRAEFDWSVIFARYVAVWEELNERRRAGPVLYPALKKRMRPDRLDPFLTFASYSTARVGPATLLRRARGADIASALARRDLHTTKFATQIFPGSSLISDLLNSLPANDWIAFDSILAGRPPNLRPPVFSAVVWLAKVGIIEFMESRQVVHKTSGAA